MGLGIRGRGVTLAEGVEVGTSGIGVVEKLERVSRTNACLRRGRRYPIQTRHPMSTNPMMAIPMPIHNVILFIFLS